MSGGFIASAGDGAVAQTIPDTTLGNEHSTLTPLTQTVDLINGGAIRGINLFHSFLEFNVGEGRSVYFSNPTGIENILSRVTGTNPSNIFGKLGVNGNANLFVINPNGIIFGTDAQLDIRGSFFASTASSFKFSDGSEFSATNPQAPPLLTINVTPGLQWGTSQPGASISNRGKLAAGQDLTLVADKLDLQGQLQAGGDLTLLAQDTVKVREEVTTPFLARSGRNLTIQGNQGIDILALLHPTQTPFVSGGNLSLISDGIISGDARFSSGGSFSIRSVSGGLANFVSEHDPIISADGDVDVAANYTGTSLLVESKGNIRFGGNINITGPDTSTLPDGPDTATLSSGSALIMRSGQSSLAYGGVNSGAVLAYGAGSVPAGITIGGNVIVQPFNGVGGIVSLSAASGDVSTRLISTNGQQQQPLYLDPNRDFFVLRRIDALGGAISLEAANGSINTGDLYSYSSSFYGNVGKGGVISLTANGSINTGDLSSDSRSDSGNVGNGGAISLTANGSINTGDLSSDSRSYWGNVGNGGAISLTANGSINTGDLSSDSGSYWGNVGNGGAISLTANGSINTRSLSSSSSSVSDNNAGNGGAISLTANGSINTRSLRSDSWSASGNAGNGGAISLTANGSIKTDYLSSDSSSSGNAGNGGAISLTANGSINTGSFLHSFSSSNSGSGGQGGNISLTANGSINTAGSLNSSSYSDSGSGGQGGNISLTANGSIKTYSLDSSSYSDSGSEGQGGNISFFAANGRITFLLNALDIIDASGASGGNITLTSPARLFELEKGSINSNASNGNGGNIQINAASVSLTNTELTTTASGTGNAGNISITADGLVKLDKSRLFTSLELGGIGKGGDITIEAGAVSLRSASFIDTATFGEGDAGNVWLKVDDSVLLDNNSAIFSITSGQGNGGNVRVEAGGAVSLVNRSNISTAVNMGAVGDGGNIDIVARSLSLSGGSQLVTSTSSSGKAGNITVNTTQGVIISGFDPNITPTQPLNVSVGNPSPLAEVEPNDSIAQAQSLTQFFLNSPNDVNPNVELSARIPYVSISGMTSGQSYIWPIPSVYSVDYYSFEITAAGTRAILDIDTPQPGGANRGLGLLNHAGNWLASNSDASPSLGAGGSTTNSDPYLRYVFSEPGTYFIRVGSWDTGAYTLQVSLDTPNVATSVVNGTLPSGLFARTQGAGAAGNVTINTPQLTVFDGGNVSATATATATSSEQGSIKVNASQVNLSGNNSGLFALTEGAAPAGSLTLQPYNNGQTLAVNLQQGAQISASTNGSGQGGTLTVTAPESISLSGNGSIISAETSGSGTGGDLTLETGTLTVWDEAKVTVSSTGTGNAGNLNVTANRVLLDNGELIAQTASGEGGNIYLKVDDLLLMRNRSLISAQAGNNGNGGNIDIDARLILAVPKEDSDIVADADKGNGGNINITTSGIFGLEYRQERTPESDITASSRFGIAGTVNINQLTIDPSQGLTNLPTEVVDASNQIDQTCSAGRGEVGKNQFTITGRGGMPTSPYEMLGDEEALEDVHPPAGFSSSRNSLPVAERAVTPQRATDNPKPPIVEASGWVINDKGQVVLTATPTPVTPHDSWLPQASCPRS